MRRRSTQLTHDDIGKLIGLFAILLGGFLYLYPPALAGFPINDGGLFYAMMRAIQANAYRLPIFVEYNGLSIPFAYPPFALYVGAAASTLLHVDPIVILQWLPAIVLIGISVAFYFLAAGLLDSPIEAGIATFLYVCTPRSMTWLVMGGGLTRSFGQLFLLLTVLFVFSLYTLRDRRFIFWSIAAGSLVVLTHPEAALQSVAACLLLWALMGRSRQATLDSLWVALGVLILTAAWWAPVLMRHGAAPFASAGGTGRQLSVNLISPLLMTFAEEPMMTIIPVLGLVGLAVCMARRGYLLPAWLVLAFLVDPRSAPTVATVPLVLMCALALHEAVLPAVERIRPSGAGGDSPSPYQSPVVCLLLAYLGVYLLVMSLYAGMNLSRVVVSPENRNAFEWAAHNTPAAGRFLILTGNTELFCDPVQEWFPVLTGRISESTIQGSEWANRGRFFERVGSLQDIQLCMDANRPGDCLRQQASVAGLQFDYLYLTKIAAAGRGCRAEFLQRVGDRMLNELYADAEFVTVYQTDAAEILRVRP